MTLPAAAFPTLNYFNGVEVQLLEKEALRLVILENAKDHQKIFIANHNLHSIYLFHKLPAFREIYKHAKVTHVDGMPLIFWGKVLGYPCKRNQRLTYLDWAPDLLREMEKTGLRLAFLGGNPKTLDSIRQILGSSHPNLSFWTHHGYFDTADPTTNQTLLHELQTFQPHVFMVGMGMPRQEIWIANHFDRLPNAIILPCGAFFDYLTGQVPTPNRILSRLGLEWFARFLAEPSRLAKRYFWEPWFLIPALANDLLNLKQHRHLGREMTLSLQKNKNDIGP